MVRAVALVGLVALTSPTLAHPADNVEALGKTVTAELAAREFGKVIDRFDSRMTAGLPADKLTATWDQIIAQAGAFQTISSTRVVSVAAFQRVEVTCAFEKATLVVAVVFDSQSKIAGLFFAPATPVGATSWTAAAYVDAKSFDERDAVVGGQVKLPGTLTMPKGAGPFPAVVLVHGSGPNDRDETLGPNKPFKDLAGGLASRGVAVLRYDKRTLKYPGLFRSGLFTVKDEVLDDVREAVSLLADTPGVDRRRIVVAGHSLGGMLAPRIAAQDSRITGIVMLAGAARPLEQAAVDQLRYLGASENAVAAAEASASQIRSPDLAADTIVDFLGSKIPGSYWLDLRHYDPAEVAASLTIRMLVLQGQRDYQVTMADFNRWSKALGGRSNATLKSYSSLNHLFLPGTGPSKPDEYMQSGHVSEDVIRDVADWILR